jgi:hypothetical protein
MAECSWPGVTEQQLADAGARAHWAAIPFERILEIVHLGPSPVPKELR